MDASDVTAEEIKFIDYQEQVRFILYLIMELNQK